MVECPDYFKLKVHGRVLEHLGIQMYQRPVNAIAELVANAWDADAVRVDINLPDSISDEAEITIKDDGVGMTPEECQDKYLYVGWNRRADNPEAKTDGKKRRVLGRKGIGKFAGFGIAGVIRIETISQETGEKTVFELDLDDLMGDDYIGTGEKQIKVVEYDGPDEERKEVHGTTVHLQAIRLKQKVRRDFPRSMARRFLLLQQQAEFNVFVNGAELPESVDLQNIQFVFPRDYEQDEEPSGLITKDDGSGWGEEKLAAGRTVRWRFMLHTETIDEEELRGVAVYANGKLVQTPFLFYLTGGISGQHALEYLTGQVQADYLDSLEDDIITTERQRINWEHDETRALLDWGAERVKQIARIWKARRAKKRRQQIEEKVLAFADRLGKLPKTEAKTVRKALEKIGSIETLSDDQFEELGSAVLTSWEQGRLHELIDEIADVESFSATQLVDILIEQEVLTGLNIAEAVKTKILTIGGLKKLIGKAELENTIRDYIAEYPWLISPGLQTFTKEKSLRKLLTQLAKKYNLPLGKEGKRVDLVLTSGDQLVVIEFMQPGLTLDVDHLSRYDLYFRAIKTNVIEANTASGFRQLTGYIVADGLARDPVMIDKIKSMRDEKMLAMDWATLISNALEGWKEFLEALAIREPRDDRLKALLEDFE